MVKQMSNSGLVTYTRISPNKTSPRQKPIDKITIHHCAGVLNLSTLGRIFANPDRNASSNYGINTIGQVGMFVEEKDRAWTSSSGLNDHRAITIEVSNSAVGGDWPVSAKSYAALINLCVDICKRNGIKRLNYTGDASGNLTEHRYFAATLCPGPYLHSRMAQIAADVNAVIDAQPYPGAFPTATVNKHRGSFTNIKRWQSFLCWYGLKTKIDGFFGDDSERQTAEFQRQNGLKIDGSAGTLETIPKAKTIRR